MRCREGEGLKILVDINHPAHVHFYKNAINLWQEDGHEVIVTAREKEITSYLLGIYDIPFEILSTLGSGAVGLTFELIRHERLLYRKIKKEGVDLGTSIGGTFLVHATKLLYIPSILFTDTEHARMQNSITFPFADTIYTPNCYLQDLGKKHKRYNGYHELAYLHPNYFTPDPSILDLLGVEKDEEFIIIRFVSWKASHDIGQTGLSLDIKKRAVKEFSKNAKVFITSEAALPRDLEKYKINIPPERIHDALYYASMYFGESPTMTTESAILGTPAICISSWACECGNFIDLSSNYGLINCYRDGEDALKKGIEHMDEDSKKKWRRKSKKLLEDKIDVTEFMKEEVTKAAVN